MNPILLLLTLLAGQSNIDRQLEELMIGGWLCAAGACPEEEISLEKEGTDLVCYAFLHSKPSFHNCRWGVEAKTLSIDCAPDIGISLKYRILRVDRKQLVLREIGTKHKATMSRIPDQ